MSNKTPPTPYEQPKATRGGKAVVPGQAPVSTLNPDTPFQPVQWVNNWPPKPLAWTKIGDNLYRLVIGSIRLQVFATKNEHSTKQAWGFGLYGLYGDLHIEPAIGFDMREAQEAAIKCIDWINNNKQGEPPYTCSIPKQAREERPRPGRPGINPPPRPGRPHLRLGPPIVITLTDEELEDEEDDEFFEEPMIEDMGEDEEFDDDTQEYMNELYKDEQ